MNIQSEKRETGIRLTVSGRVDTVTSPQLQEAILNGFQKTKELTLDFTEVEYISSAGLRALLIGEKTAKSKGGAMRLTHVNDTVISVLKSTGFINILTILESEARPREN